MIELTFTTAFMLYLCWTMAFVLGLWGHQHYYARKKEIISPEHKLCMCEYCHNAYLEDSLKGVNQCPRCGLFNKHNKYAPDVDKTKK